MDTPIICMQVFVNVKCIYIVFKNQFGFFCYLGFQERVIQTYQAFFACLLRKQFTCICPEVFVKILQNAEQNTCARVSFFCAFCEIFKSIS